MSDNERHIPGRSAPVRFLRSRICVGPASVRPRDTIDVEARAASAFASFTAVELEPELVPVFEVLGVALPTQGKRHTWHAGVGQVGVSVAPMGLVSIRVRSKVDVTAVFRCVLGGLERRASTDGEVLDSLYKCLRCRDIFYEFHEAPECEPARRSWHHPRCPTLVGESMVWLGNGPRGLVG